MCRYSFILHIPFSEVRVCLFSLSHLFMRRYTKYSLDSRDLRIKPQRKHSTLVLLSIFFFINLIHCFFRKLLYTCHSCLFYVRHQSKIKVKFKVAHNSLPGHLSVFISMITLIFLKDALKLNFLQVH